MRFSGISRLAAAALVFASLASCDASTTPFIAGIGNVTGATGSGITISPNPVNTRVGASVQLTTNLSAADAANIEWSSLQSTIAAVSPSGVVTGVAGGTTSVVARLATDTTVAGTATITVTP